MSSEALADRAGERRPGLTVERNRRSRAHLVAREGEGEGAGEGEGEGAGEGEGERAAAGTVGSGMAQND